MGTRLLRGVLASFLCTGCTMFLDVGVDRSEQPTAKAVGYHVALGAALTIDPRRHGAVSVAASRRIDKASLPVSSFRSDGWELRGDFNLRPKWRLTGFGRRAGIESVTASDMSSTGGRVWSGGLGLTRYWPSAYGVLSVTAGPDLQTADLGPSGSASSFGATVRVSYNFDAPLIVYGMCDAKCRASVESSRPSSSSGSGGGRSSPETKRGTSCYYRTGKDARGNPRSEWYCP